MAKRPKRPRDPMQLAKLIGDIATGERPNDSPKPETPEQAAATAACRKGGLKGGARISGLRGSGPVYFFDSLGELRLHLSLAFTSAQ